MINIPCTSVLKDALSLLFFFFFFFVSLEPATPVSKTVQSFDRQSRRRREERVGGEGGLEGRVSRDVFPVSSLGGHREQIQPGQFLTSSVQPFVC